MPSPDRSRRYRRVAVTYTVAREQVPRPGLRSRAPTPAAEFARELLAAHDDDRALLGHLPERPERAGEGTISCRPGASRRRSCTPARCWGPRSAKGAAHLILVHNHPSGDATPSKEDVSLTRQLVEGARLLGIRLHDHVIVGNGSGHWVSLAQRGLL